MTLSLSTKFGGPHKIYEPPWQEQEGVSAPMNAIQTIMLPFLVPTLKNLDQHSSSVQQTEQNDLEKKNKQDYHNCLNHVYTFWEEKYPEYYEGGVRELKDEELADDDMFWWKNKHDIVYEGLNVQMVKAFVGQKKNRVLNLRKYSYQTVYKI